MSPWYYTFQLEKAKNFSTKGRDDKRQVTDTFAVSATGIFLPMQLIYSGETKSVCQMLNFHVTFNENHWSNQLKATEYFQKLIVHYMDQIRENMT